MGLDRGINLDREVRGGADAKRDTAFGKKRHHTLVLDGADAMVDAICA